MKLTGHKTESVYRRYAIVSEADLAEGVGRLAAMPSRTVDRRAREAWGKQFGKLEPTIGLEPMTCRLRTEDTGELSTTEPTLDDLSPPALEASPKGDGDPRSS
jgi:hypothetical protein